MPKLGYNTTDENTLPVISYKLSPEEREIVLVMDDKDRTWKASCSSPTYMRKFEKQGWKCTGEEHYPDGTICTKYFEAPSQKSISIGKYERPKKQVSEETIRKMQEARNRSKESSQN